MQTTINQRLKFILDSLGMSARSFSRAIGVADNNTQNYLGDSPALPKADYLEKVVLHFKSINPAWLLTGEGEPFIGDAPTPPVVVTNKKNKGPVQNNTGNHNTITNNLSLDNCKRDLTAATKEIDLLRQQLTMAQALLEAKEETLSLLRAGHNRPN